MDSIAVSLFVNQFSFSNNNLMMRRPGLSAANGFKIWKKEKRQNGVSLFTMSPPPRRSTNYMVRKVLEAQTRRLLELDPTYLFTYLQLISPLQIFSWAFVCSVFCKWYVLCTIYSRAQASLFYIVGIRNCIFYVCLAKPIGASVILGVMVKLCLSVFLILPSKWFTSTCDV